MGLAVLAFVVTLTFILGVYWMFVVRPEQEVQEAFWKRLRVKAPTARARATLEKGVQRLSAVPSLDTLLNRGRDAIQPVELLINQSGARLTVGTFLLASGTCAVLALFLVLRLLPFLPFLPLIAIGAAILAGMVPTSVLRMMRTNRLLKFEEQFPEALALISRALKAGHTFTTGLSMVAEEMPKPLGPEFRLLYDQQNYGMPMPDALKEFAQRIPLLDARFFVTAVLIQRESGGNLAEVLDNLATVIRDRFRVKRQIRVISAHARLTGWVLIGVPPSLALALFVINANHWETLTGSDLGIQLIVAAIVLQITGSLIIRKLVRIEY
jgi:tight adherence protein B